MGDLVKKFYGTKLFEIILWAGMLAIIFLPWLGDGKPVAISFLTFLGVIIPVSVMIWVQMMTHVSKFATKDVGDTPALGLYLRKMAFLVGGLLMVSGFVKLQDIAGFSYKLAEYGNVFEMDIMIDNALYLAWFVSVFEIVLAFALITGWVMRITSILLVGMMVFFTFLTAYSAITGEVTDCGCFGDALKLTPMESFVKDVILTFATLPFLILAHQMKPAYPGKIPMAATLASFLIFGYFSYWTYQHLPVLDFRPYKVGSNMIEATIRMSPDQIEDPPAHDYPYYHQGWPPPEDKFKMGITEEGMYFGGISYSCDSIPANEFFGNTLLIIIKDFEEAPEEAVKYSVDLHNSLADTDVKTYCPTSTGKSTLEDWKKKYNIPYCLVYEWIDETVLKTMVRSSPGYLLLKDGIIMGKWHYNDAPDKEEILSLLK